jgi:hypothetical protein
VRIVIITIEGVLSETVHLKTSPPTKLGKDLFDALKGPYRVILLSNGSDGDLARYWLRKEGFKGWAMVLSYPHDSVMDLSSWKVSSVREMLGDGWDIAFVMDNDSYVHRAMLDQGVPSMMVSYPAMSDRPGKLPADPGPIRAWDEIAGRVEEQNLLKQEG